jgi:hypothetical protein
MLKKKLDAGPSRSSSNVGWEDQTRQGPLALHDTDGKENHSNNKRTAITAEFNTGDVDVVLPTIDCWNRFPCPDTNYQRR